MVMRTVFQVVVLGQFVEDVVFNCPALVTDSPDDLCGIRVEFAGEAIQRQWDFMGVRTVRPAIRLV